MDRNNKWVKALVWIVLAGTVFGVFLTLIYSVFV